MCGRFDTSHLSWRDIHEQLSGFGTVKTEPLNLQPDPDVRPTTPQLAARWDGEGWQLEKMRWGLVPFWRNGKPLKDTVKGADDGFKLTTFNCKVETCHSASTFRDALAKRRCIVPASTWYEWTGEKGAKVKHRFARADGRAIWFAGLWDRCATPDAGEIRSFTILTGPSAGWLSQYHDRAGDPGAGRMERLARSRPRRGGSLQGGSSRAVRTARGLSGRSLVSSRMAAAAPHRPSAAAPDQAACWAISGPFGVKVSSPSPCVTRTLAPSRTSPFRIMSASGSCR